ncbi:hypothetical protein [Spiroplasma endosymbiont of Agriotes lineatus]|uniref:hypothetical protein n=1 Tax=Spiroplasma endosymbiont of Agriotes lineatus TaxID=3077930 RepID=UPI0030CF966E
MNVRNNQQYKFSDAFKAIKKSFKMWWMRCIRLFLDLNYIMFISLVPLGALFDTKQPPKPNMEQFFMKQEKQTTNPS